MPVLNCLRVIFLLDKLRRYIGFLIFPFANILVKLKVTPNLLTLIGFVFSLLSSYLIVSGSLLSAGFLILLSGFFDVLDGAVARLSGLTSKFGGFFDSVMDRFSDAVVLSSIILYDQSLLLLGLIALIGSLMVSYCRARGESLGVNLAGVGLAERGERMIIISVGVMLNVIQWSLLLLVILCYITIFMRIFKVWSSLR
ncbi:MAG: CDP-alcohol phosphatidyltransferase family protein [Candidatus Methanomethylicota archaeon]|nr:MAG: CDP-alcohol phosphatidyltransferase family protein [Candidatus Verstraetearchaeota archaeon]